jgi:hypothetical protein
MGRRTRRSFVGRLLFGTLVVSCFAAGLPIAVPAATDASSASPIPAPTLRQIRAEYGQFAYVPAFVPSGFIFTSWRTEPAAHSYLMDRLDLMFGRNGTLLEWTVSDGRDRDGYADCSKRPYYTSKTRIRGRLVYYARGNHGDSAWTCFSARTKSGYGQPIGIDLWVANDPGRPSRLTAMRMVASASGSAPRPAAVAPRPPTPPRPTTTAPTTTAPSPPPPPPPPSPPPPAPTAAPAPAAGNCAPSYPDVCIPPPPPDLDCGQVSYRNFRVIYSVPSPDPHRFDGDHDGIGCES